jgi:hypothetical protein
VNLDLVFEKKIYFLFGFCKGIFFILKWRGESGGEGNRDGVYYFVLG